MDLKQTSINDALNNSKLEDALVNMKNNSDDMNTLIELVHMFAQRIKDAGGFLLPLTDSTIEPGVENIDFIESDFKGDLCVVPTDEGTEMGIAFTSVDKFEGQLYNFANDKVSGGILLISTALEFFTFDKRFDGLVINPGTDEVVLNKETVTALATMIGGTIDSIHN